MNWLSYGRTFAPPDLNSLRPSLQISDTRPFGPFNAILGNPSLEIFLADNIDLAAEWYYDEGSFAAITFFFKNIENYIGTETTQEPPLNVNGDPITDPSARFPDTDPDGPSVESLPGDPVAQFNILQQINTGDAQITGWEFALQQLFGETGFGLQTNYTIVDSDAEFDAFETEEVVNLIGPSDAANLVGFYENDLFQIRVAANWGDEFLFAENQLRVQGEPVFFDEFLQHDASASNNVRENVTIFLEALNINDEDQRQRGRLSCLFRSVSMPNIRAQYPLVGS